MTWRRKARDDVEKVFGQLRRYVASWEAISKEGKQTCMEAANCILSLREFADGSRTVSSLGSVSEIEQLCAEALKKLESNLHTMERLLGGIQLGLQTARSVADESMKAEAEREPVFATLPARYWEEMVEEVYEMHSLDYLVKSSYVSDFLNERIHDRKSFSLLTSVWLTQPYVWERRVETILAAFEAEIAAAEVIEQTISRRETSHQEGRSDAVSFLLNS